MVVLLLAAVAYIAAGVILVTMLRPAPCVIARRLETQDNAQDKKPTSAQAVDKPSRLVWVGALVIIIPQLVMVGIMTMTPVRMRARDHSMGAVGLVIGLHVGAMWLPSLITGPLVDGIRPRLMAISGASIVFVKLLEQVGLVGIRRRYRL